MVKGYKVFNPDWTCKGFRYETGVAYEESGKIEVCKKGFHFCRNAADCFDYYSFSPRNHVAEVIAYGEILEKGNKSCTNKIKIVREINWHEVLDNVNIGIGCTGFKNSGNWNSGNYNSGNCNSGNRNSGDYNSGDCNSGNWNSGNYNSGDYNSGNCNSGDWNKTNFSGGCFNTVEPRIYMFNMPSDLTYTDWMDSKARYLLNRIGNKNIKWVCEKEMTDEEKAIIKAIPNFDREIFKEITGIDIDAD